MINAENWTLCGHNFLLSKTKAMECLIYRNESLLYQAATLELFRNWERIFPNVETFASRIPQETCKVLEKFQDELQNLFWDLGEEIPYDADELSSTLNVKLISSDFFQIVQQYRREARQIEEQAQADLDHSQRAYLSGNSINIGFGLRGAIASGIANAGAGLIDYGINRLSDNMTAKRYQTQLKELVHGSETQKVFSEYMLALIDIGCYTSIESIAKRNAEDSILSLKNQDWNKKRPAYTKLSVDDKICECLSRLENDPINEALYYELMELTGGTDSELVRYGNEVIGYDTGNEIQKEIGSRAYQDALALPELSLQDIEAKLAALESACALLKLKKEEDETLNRLLALKEKVTIQQKTADEWERLTKILETRTQEELIQQGIFNDQTPIHVFVQEMYYCQNQYRNLPDPEIAVMFAEAGNGVPQLIRGEVEATSTKEPIPLWIKWAKEGNPYALLRLGLCRLHGNGVTKDPLRSRQMIQRAANAGYPPAMYLLKQIALEKYKPGFGYTVTEDRTKYDTQLEEYAFPEETYHRYLSFGKKENNDA